MNSRCSQYQGVLEAYADYLPLTPKTPRISLREGGTPLYHLNRFARAMGLPAYVRLYAKYEGANPTGSFKDRGMVVAVAKALEEGATAIMCASTGNTSASAAAYAAACGLRCFVVVPAGKIALGKLAQALTYGAKVIAVDANFDEALRLTKEITSSNPVVLVNSVNPYRLEGQKTAAFEICDTLGLVPDYLAIPVGNAGNITAYWKGFKEYHAKGKIRHLPRMLGFQAAGAAPIVRGHPIESPQTVATAIRIGNPAGWKGAVQARDESGGTIEAVTDEEILNCWETLAKTEGVFSEPASCASLAGVVKLARDGYFEAAKVKRIDDPVRNGEPVLTVVAVLTGNGLKDPGLAMERAPSPVTVPADRNAIEREMGLR
ncbi:MAG TPA: threonine synthase [Clostridia bacterium]|nr:threonine synthase [Clostridia bacterium]